MKTTIKSHEVDKSIPKSLLVGIAVVIIPLAVFAAYLPAFDAEWVADDDMSVYNNPLVTKPDGLYKIWFTTEDVDFWPMTKTVFWIEYQIFGESPRGYHIVNVALHALASILIYLVLRRLKIPAALLASLVFALHPVNASSVAWVSETKNTLSMVFLALTLLCYLRFERRRRWLWYALALLGFALAVASKTSVVMLPVGLLGLAWWQRGKITRRDVLLAGPFFLLSAGMAAMTLSAQGQHLDVLTQPLDGIYRLAGAGWVVWFYIYKALAPVNLCLVYPHWKDTIQSLGWVSFLPTAALVGLFVVLVLKRRTWWARPVLFALGYCVLMALPVLGFFDMTIMMLSLVANHLQYLSIIGIISLVCAAGWKLAQRWKPEFRFLSGVVAVGMLVGLGTLTWKRAEVYKTEESLWRDNFSKNSGAWMAQYKIGAVLGSQSDDLLAQSEALRQEALGLWNRARVFAARGNQRQADIYNQSAQTKSRQADVKFQQSQALLRQAEPYCRKAVELQPMDPKCFSNLGLVLVNLGRVDEGIEQYRRGVKANEYFEPKRRNVVLLYGLGFALLKKNQAEEAAAVFKQAYLLQPKHTKALKQAVLILRKLKKNDEIIELLTMRIKTHPEDAGAHQDLAVVLFEMGKTDQAMMYLERSLQIDPNNPRAYMTRGDILLETGKPHEAIESFRKAIQLNRHRRFLNDYDLRIKLAAAQVRIGQNADAMVNFIIILRANPNHAPAKTAVRELMKRIGHTPEAARCYERALKVIPGWIEGLQNLAWIRATHPDATVRNTDQALFCAKQLKARAGSRNPVAMDTFAAALAQAGQFSEALAAAKAALKLAKDNKNEELAQKIEGRIKLYEKGRPYREGP